MFEFAVRTTIGRYDLETAEGRIQAMRAAAPIVAGIRDQSLRPEYARVLAGLLGVEVEQVSSAVARAGKAGSRPAYETRRHPEPTEAQLEPTADELRDALPRPDLRDPVVLAERQLLQVVLQQPTLLDPAELDRLDGASFSAPAHRSVWDAVGASGRPGGSTAAWTDAVVLAAPAAVQPLVAELAVAPLPVTPDRATGLPSRRYAASLVFRLREVGLTRRIADALSQLRRLDSAAEPDAVAQRELGQRLQTLQRELADLRDQQEG
jgi:DNA primase